MQEVFQVKALPLASCWPAGGSLVMGDPCVMVKFLAASSLGVKCGEKAGDQFSIV